MSQSPGHRRAPGYRITTERVPREMSVELDGEVLARSSDVLRVDEQGHPPRYYFARSVLPAAALVRSTTTSECPFKGVASYFTLKHGEREYPDAVWSYESPYDEHADLAGRIAFYEERHPQLRVRATP